MCRIKFAWTIVVYLALTTALAACGALDSQTPPPATHTPQVTPTTQATGTPAPSATPQTPMLVLLAGSQADLGTVQRLQGQLPDLASQAGLRFQLLPELNLLGSETSIQYVIAASPYAGLAELAASYPKTRFLAVGFGDLEPAQNLFVIRPAAGQPADTAFIAGYMAATITPDWRVGVIAPAGTEQGAVIAGSFANGVSYLCGLCRPVYPPFPLSGYPLVVELDPASEAADWQAALTYFQTWQVETVYVSADVANNGLLNALAEAGIQLIGDRTPPPALRQAWVASIQGPDPADSLSLVWEKMLSGSPGEALALPVSIRETDSGLLSPGRQQFVESMMQDLFAGYIHTGRVDEG